MFGCAVDWMVGLWLTVLMIDQLVGWQVIFIDGRMNRDSYTIVLIKRLS